MINNSITCDCMIFHNMSVREISLLDLKQENWNTKSSKLCMSPPLPGHYLPVPRPFSTKMKGLERPKRATGVAQCGAEPRQQKANNGELSCFSSGIPARSLTAERQSALSAPHAPTVPM